MSDDDIVMDGSRCPLPWNGFAAAVPSFNALLSSSGGVPRPTMATNRRGAIARIGWTAELQCQHFAKRVAGE
jgi:hypothetical protein